MKNEKNSVLHFATGAAFVILIVLGLACASVPTVQVELGANYREYVQSPIGNERVIDRVTVNSNPAGNYTDQNTISPQRLGAPYQVREDSPERHRHEDILDKLLNLARRWYPSEVVSIRNASIGGYRYINPHQEKYYEVVGNQTYERTRTVWERYTYYIADVITTEPMPDPVTHSEDFTMPGATRADIYRRARNWLEDNTQRRRIRIDSENFDRGRIQGTVTCATRADQTYIVTSTYTIDVYDARVEIRFTDAVVRRTDPALERVGDPEPIFLQSIADATLAELVDFSTTLRSTIISR